MNTARKALDKAGRGGKPLRYRPDESEKLFMDLKDHIFPMVGGVVTLASQGHLPFPRQGVGYEKDAVLASELPLMRRGNMGAFDEQDDIDETGGVDGTILAPQRSGAKPSKDAPKFGLMAIQARGRQLVMQMQAAGGGRPGKVAFLSPAEMKGHESARSPTGADGGANAGQNEPVAVPKGPELADAEATVERLRQALRDLEALVSKHQVATANGKASLIANTLQLELATNEASAQAGVMRVLQSTKLQIQSEVDGKRAQLADLVPVAVHDQQAEQQAVLVLMTAGSLVEYILPTLAHVGAYGSPLAACADLIAVDRDVVAGDAVIVPILEADGAASSGVQQPGSQQPGKEDDGEPAANVQINMTQPASTPPQTLASQDPKSAKLGRHARESLTLIGDGAPEIAREPRFQVRVAAGDVDRFKVLIAECSKQHAAIEGQTVALSDADRAKRESAQAALASLLGRMKDLLKVEIGEQEVLNGVKARQTNAQARVDADTSKLHVLEAEMSQCSEEIAECSDGLAAAKARLRKLNIDHQQDKQEAKAGSMRLRGLFPMTPASSIRKGRDADTASLMRRLDEEELSQLGDGRPIWNKAKTVSDVKWSGRTTMPLSEWNSYRPEVACGLIQEWGALLYAYLVVYCDGHLSEVFDEFPSNDGFGVLEAIRKQLRTRSEELEMAVQKEWEALEMDFGFEGSRSTFAEFLKKSKELVRKYNEVRVPDAHGRYTKLGTTKQWRAKLTKRLAKRFDKLQDRLEAEEDRDGQLTNEQYMERILKFEKKETSKGTKAFQPAPKGYKFAFIKKKPASSAAAHAFLAEEGGNGDRLADGFDWTLVSESGSGNLAGAATGSQAPGDPCYLHPNGSHTNAECYKQHPHLAPQRGAQGSQVGGRGPGGRGQGGGGSGRGRGRGKQCYLCGLRGHVQRDCPKKAQKKVWKGGRKLTSDEATWCRNHNKCYECGGDHVATECEALEPECKAWKDVGIHAARKGSANSAETKTAEQGAHTADAGSVDESTVRSFLNYLQACGGEQECGLVLRWATKVPGTEGGADADAAASPAQPGNRPERAERAADAASATSDLDVKLAEVMEDQVAHSGREAPKGAVSAASNQEMADQALQLAEVTGDQELSGVAGGNGTGTTGEGAAGDRKCCLGVKSEDEGPSTPESTRVPEKAGATPKTTVGNSLRLRADLQQHKEGWSVDMELPVASLGEVLARPNSLVLFQMKDEMRACDPHVLEWTMETRGDVQSAFNSAGVRVPPASSADSADALALMRWDLAQAFARVVSDKYTTIAIPRDMQQACKSGEAAELLGQLVAYKCSNGVQDLPKFMQGFDYVELLAEHKARLRHPEAGQVKFMSVGAGIGGGALAARGAGCREKDMVLIDACEEHCDQLRKEFPTALVLHRNVHNEEARREFMAFRGQVGLLEASANCQPSVDMLKVHDKDDARHLLGRAAVSIAIDVQPKVFVLEDVVGLRHNQPAEFKMLLGLLDDAFARVVVLESNARHAMVGQNRNRLFFVCANEVDIEPAVRAVWRQKHCHRAGNRTHPTMREMLQPYVDVRRTKGVFIPHLRWAKKGADGRPQRLRSIDTYSTTITSGYGVRGGLSIEAFKRYKECDADDAAKEKSIRLDGQQWGVLNGFSINTSYSTAQRCTCPTCTTPAGRPRGRVADIERGNVIVPAQALLIYGPLIREIDRHASSGAASADARQAAIAVELIQTCVFEEQWHANGCPEDDLAAAVDDAEEPGGSGNCELDTTLLEGGVVVMPEHNDGARMVTPEHSCLCPVPEHSCLRLGHHNAKQDTSAMAGIELAVGHSSGEEEDEDIEMKCPDCGTVVNGGFECPICNPAPMEDEGADAETSGELLQQRASALLQGEALRLASDKQVVDAERDKQRARSLRKRSEKAKAQLRAQMQADADGRDATPSTGTTPTVEADKSQRAVPVAEGGVDSESKDDAEVMPSKAPRANDGVSDEEAEAFVRIVHQRYGCRPVRLIKRDLRCGNLEGPHITNEQFEHMDLKCPTCLRTMQRRGPVRRRALKKAQERKRILEEVAVDLVGPRRRPSMRYHTGQGAAMGGGNRYFVLFVDSPQASGRLFIEFASEKAQLEAIVRDVRRRMEIEAKSSVEYDGRHPIKVGCWKSDRDSNLTSDEAIVDMLEARILHRMAAADAKDQTPFLDNRVRRVIDLMRVYLDGCGLGIEYWEHAARHAVDMINTEGCEKHPLKHSPLRRWTGRAVDKNYVYTFGCDVYPYLELGKRANQDKIDPVAPGGTGRWRYMGVHRGLGGESRGGLILDTKTRRMRVMKNFKVDENMVHVRELPEPAATWEEPEGDDPLASDDEDSAGGGADTERVLLRELETPHGDHDLGDSEDEHPVDEHEGGDEERAGEETKHDGGVSTPAKSRKKRARRGPRGSRRTNWRWAEGQRIIVQQKNPKRGKSFHRYEKYKAARTVTEFLQLGGSWADLKNDSDRGYVLKDVPDSKPFFEAANVGWVRTPKGLSKAHNREARLAEARYAEAKTKYAAHVESFHQERKSNGVFVPDGVAHQVRLLPFWEAASAQNDDVDRELQRLEAMKSECAKWGYRADHKVLDQRGGQEQALEQVAQITKAAAVLHEQLHERFSANISERLRGKRASTIPTPKTYDEAMRGHFAEDWKAAVTAEMANLDKYKVYRWVPRPVNEMLIDSNWAWRVKPDDDGMVAKLKARLVVRGFRQVYGVHFHSTMAPVGKLTTFRVLLAEAAQRGMDVDFLDIRSAYLTADLDIPQHMTPPKGVEPPQPGHVMLLEKGLYGLRQGARLFHEKFKKDLKAWGFRSGSGDPCLYVKQDGDDQIRILLFVDDLAIFSDSTEGGRALKADLRTKIESKYEYSTGHEEHVYLGMAIHRINKNQIFLTQSRYIEDVMIKFGFNECRSVKTPSTGAKISIEDCPSEDPAANRDATRYREICGVLRWLEQCTRPDISTTLSELCKVQINPGKVHMQALEHLLRYVSSTRDRGILYGRRERDHPYGLIVGYTDSNWAGDADTQYSRGGCVFMSWGAPVSWTSFKMKSVAASSAESEYMAMAWATREAIWLKALYSSMGYSDLSATTYGKLCDQDYKKVRLSKYKDPYEKAMMLNGDNKAALAMSKNPVLHKRSKHIHIAFHITRQAVQSKVVAPVYMPTGENIADLMTKSLGPKLHDHHTEKLLMTMRDGKLFTLQGDLFEERGPDLTRLKLYEEEPAELRPPSDSFDKIIKMFEVEYEVPTIAFDVSETLRGWAREEQLRNAPAAPRMQGRQPKSALAMPKSHMKDSSGSTPILSAAAQAELQLFDTIIEDFLGFVGVEAAAAETSSHVCQQNLRALHNAIVDSGASGIYVSKGVQLENVQPGQGSVSVANGVREAIAEVGDLGPLKGAQKVNSFSRTLVSVSALAKQFGGVFFDNKHVFVASTATAEPHVTKIGDMTESRLYSFDLEALEQHARRVAAAAG